MNDRNQWGVPVDGVSKQQLRENAPWFLGLGIGLVILGMLAFIYAYAATLFSVVYLGAFLVIMGCFEGVKAFKMKQWSNFFLHLFLSVLYIVGGGFIVLHPVVNAVTLTLLLGIFFVVSGILRIIFSLVSNVPHSGWLMVNGIATLILGACIWYQWPMSGLWVIGALVGIEAMFTGWTFIMLSMMAKRIE